MHVEQANALTLNGTGLVIFSPEITLDLFRQWWHSRWNGLHALLPLLVRCHLLQFTVGPVLICHNLLQQKAVDILKEQASLFCSIVDIFGMIGLYRPFESLFDDGSESAKETLNQCPLTSLVGFPKYQINTAVLAPHTNQASQSFQAVRMVAPRVIKRQLQWNAVARPFTLDPKLGKL